MSKGIFWPALGFFTLGMALARAEVPPNPKDEGMRAYISGDYTRAMEILLPFAQKGSALSQFYIGKMYYEGKGVQKNDAEAINWFRKAAARGSAESCTMLGFMYRNGEGVSKNEVEALRWFQKAASIPQITLTAPCKEGPEPTSDRGLAVYIKCRHYNITGLTPEQLLQKMDHLGPIVKGSRALAAAGWKIWWRDFTTLQTAQGCIVDHVKVRMEITLTYPIWHVSAPPPTLIEAWNRFVADLQWHEEGHKALDIKAGYDILKALKTMPPAASCDTLRSAAEARGESILANLRQENSRFDETSKPRHRAETAHFLKYFLRK